MAQGKCCRLRNAPDPLYLDGALLAQEDLLVSSLLFFSMGESKCLSFWSNLISKGSWWFNLTNYCGGNLRTVIQARHFQWDANLLYYPPPYFPASSVSRNLTNVKMGK